MKTGHLYNALWLKYVGEYSQCILWTHLGIKKGMCVNGQSLLLFSYLVFDIFHYFSPFGRSASSLIVCADQVRFIPIYICLVQIRKGYSLLYEREIGSKYK